MEIKLLNMKKIVANPLQPRQEFDNGKIQELADSIKEGELLQPIVVRLNGGNFEIVCGERRFKAFQILKEPRIPCVIRDIKDDTEALEKSLIENWQRDDLKSGEKERALRNLWESKRYNTHELLAKKLGHACTTIEAILGAEKVRNRLNISDEISTRTIADTSGLNDEPRKKIIKAVEEKRLDADKVRDVVRKVKEFPEPEQQIEILEEFEKQEEWGKEAFDTIIQNKKEIIEGKRHPEIIIGSDKYQNFIDEMEHIFMATKNYGIANIDNLPAVHKKHAIILITGTIAYWIEQLRLMGGEDGVKEILEKAKVI